MNHLLFLFILLLFVGCSSQTDQTSIREENSLELVDIRIHNDGSIRINGISTQESMFSSDLENLDITNTTKVRLLFSDVAYIRIVNTVLRDLATIDLESDVQSIRIPQEEFANYDDHNLHIDVLSSGKLLFNGNTIFPKDLPIALASINNKEIKILISVSDQSTFEQVYDVQNTLIRSDFKNITSPLK